MDVLVVNCGSSSLKLDRLDTVTGARASTAVVERVGTDGCTLRVGSGIPEPLDAADHEQALASALPHLGGDAPPEAVVHRVVHGGEAFTAPTLLTDDAVERISGLAPLAPLHLPPNLAGIVAARDLLPHVPHVAVFDTAFHDTLPTRARTYAIDPDVAREHGIRRYGFHGPSHAWVAGRAAEHLGEDLRDLRIVTCHLGNGASVAAVEYGRSVETSMGMTPLEGLVMGTRSGDVDPGVLVELVRRGFDAPALDELLNRRSGLAGLSGVGNDLRDIEERAADGDERCRLAIHAFAHRLRKYIGAYAAVMGGVDAVVFTGGIGENSALVRHRAAQRLEFLGARLDEDRNRDARVSREQPVAEISTPHSRVRLLVVATDEAHGMARDAARLLRGAHRVDDAGTIPVKISARHVHLTDEAVEALFGPGYQLTERAPLGQPGQWVANERVTLVGPRRRIENVGIIGPCRGKVQVEVSRTDEFHLGLDAPVRASGDVANSPGITLEGPAGRYTASEGVICAQRHIHMRPQDAERFGVSDKDLVEVEIDSDGRDLVFGDVLVRVKDSYALEMHIDTDEANAAEIRPGHEAMLATTSRHVRLRRRSARFDG